MNVDKSGHFWTTYLPCLVNVVCECLLLIYFLSLPRVTKIKGIGAKAISRSRGGLYDCRSSIFFFESFSYCNYIFVVLKSNLFCLAGKSHDPHIHSLLGRLHLSGLFIEYLHAYADQQAYFIVQFLFRISWSFRYRFSAKLVWLKTIYNCQYFFIPSHY